MICFAYLLGQGFIIMCLQIGLIETVMMVLTCRPLCDQMFGWNSERFLKTSLATDLKWYDYTQKQVVLTGYWGLSIHHLTFINFGWTLLQTPDHKAWF